MSYSIFRVEKVKNAVNTRALQRHNQRENKNYGNEEIDHSRTHLNYDFLNPERIKYTDKIDQIIKEGYNGLRQIRSDAIKHVDGIITSDKYFFDRLTPDKQKQFFKDSLDFIKKEYGEKNLLYATVHLDEKTPHMHFGFVPLTDNGRLSAKDVLGNKKALSVLQDRFNDFVNQKGYGLERGEVRSGVKHIPMQEYKEIMLNQRVDDLQKEVTTLQNNIDKLAKIEQKIKNVEDIDDKIKKGLFTDKVTIDKTDFEAFKDLAKSGIATHDKLEELKKANAEIVQDFTSQTMDLKIEKDQLLDINKKLSKENKSLRKENDYLKRENGLLKSEVERFKQVIIDLGNGLKRGMKQLANELKDNQLFDRFFGILTKSSKEALGKFDKDREVDLVKFGFKEKENELKKSELEQER